MTPEQFTLLLKKKQPELHQLMGRTLPVKVSVMAQKFFMNSFRKGGFTDSSFVAWKRSKRQDNPKHPDRAYKTLLSRRNNLHSSIRRKVSPFTAIIFTDVVYARVHNEGGIAGSRAHRFTMPKRQFMGESATLNREIRATIAKELNNLLNAN